MNKKIKKKNIIIFISLIIIFIVCILFIYYKFLKIEKVEIKKEDNNVYNNIDIESDEVKKLYDIIPNFIVEKESETFEEGYTAYLTNDTANYKNTNLGVLSKALYNLKDSDNQEATCQDLIESGAWEIANGPTECSDEVKYQKLNINKTNLKEEVKKIIGKDNEIKFKYQSFYDYWFVCSYNNDDYYCYLKEGTNGGVGSFRQIVKAQSNDKVIKLYDKYVFYDIKIDNNINYYTSFEKEKNIITLPYEEGSINNIADFENKVGKNSSAKYIHTFKKDSDGNYYWVSSNLDKN